MNKKQNFAKKTISGKLLHISITLLALVVLLVIRIQGESAQVINSEAASIENVTVTSGYVAIVNGEEVAVAAESEVLETAFIEAKESISVSLSFEDPELEIVEKQLASTDLEESETESLEQKMEQAILSTSDCEGYIYSVTVSGGETYVFALASKEDVEEALTAAIAANTEYDFCAVCVEDADGNVTVELQAAGEDTTEENTTEEETAGEDTDVELEFLTSVTVEKIPASGASLITESVAEELLCGQYSEPVYYTIQSGDCFSSIAKAFGISVDELLAMNEGYTVKTILSVGDELTIENYEDVLQFRVTVYYSEEEEIPYETEYIENDEWYDNVSETVVEGVNGTKLVSYVEVIENGETVSVTEIGEEITGDAVNEQIEIGTIETPTYKYPVSGTITSYFGERWGSVHRGIDIGVGVGTPVCASRGGTVIRASEFSTYGNCVDIRHSDGSVTRYAHLDSFAVSVGDVVSQGEVIAYSGNTGNTTGPHLHFEILINGVAVDPLLYLTK